MGINFQESNLDSDTNSHCALILEEPTPPSQHRTNPKCEKNNINNNYEMHEIDYKHLSSINKNINTFKHNKLQIKHHHNIQSISIKKSM